MSLVIMTMWAGHKSPVERLCQALQLGDEIDGIFISDGGVEPADQAVLLKKPRLPQITEIVACVRELDCFVMSTISVVMQPEQKCEANQ